MFRHKRRTGAFVSALFLTLFALCMEFVPGTMTASAKSALSGPVTIACSHVRFLGVRGSGDPPQGKNDKTDQYQSMGGVVYSVYTRFLTKMKSKGIDVFGEGLNYDAVPISKYKEMSASVAGGVKELTRLLNANRDCVVLAGYSQGAWVIHDTLDDTLHNLPLSARLRVKAVLAFGDPLFDPQSRGSILLGSSNRLDLLHYRGTVGKKSFPSWVSGVQDYCKLYDPICTSLPGGFAACAQQSQPSWCHHYDYKTDKALQERAASWLAGLFAKPANPSAPKLSMPTQLANFSQFVGIWKYYINTFTITADGKAILMGRARISCSYDPRPPCEGSYMEARELNTTIMFNRVDGNTAHGTVTRGTGYRDQNRKVIPIGGSMTITLATKDKLKVPDGNVYVLCADDPNNIVCVSNT